MFGGFGMTELLVVLAIVVLLFGTTKLRSLGGDLGAAIKSFRSAVDDNSKSPGKASSPLEDHSEAGRVDGAREKDGADTSGRN